MTNNSIDPVTGITIPNVGQEPGPNYAQDISDALLSLAHLTHTGAANLDGYQIPTAGLNIDADLSTQGNNVIALRSARFESQSAVLSGVGDVNCVYFKGGDCYVNNGSGTPIPLTKDGVLNVVTTNNYPTLEVSVNHTINASDADVVFNYDSSSGTKILTVPLASTVQAGRFYYIKDKTGRAGANNIVVSPSGSNTIDGAASYAMDSNYAAVLVMSDGVSNYQLYSFNRAGSLSGSAVTIASGTTVTISGALILPVKAVTSGS